jgi:hypothetical protein
MAQAGIDDSLAFGAELYWRDIIKAATKEAIEYTTHCTTYHRDYDDSTSEYYVTREPFKHAIVHIVDGLDFVLYGLIPQLEERECNLMVAYLQAAYAKEGQLTDLIDFKVGMRTKQFQLDLQLQ